MNARTPDPSSKRRVLVVDDNEWNLKLLEMLLVSEGHEVAGAGEAQQALALVESFEPHLILMDLELPGMDGLTLARRLKSDASTRDIRIVALTAHTAEDVEGAVRASGCAGLLTKPVDPTTFRETVRQYLVDAGAGAVSGSI
jgi:two-component system, cell cycle response regulator DivK